KIIYKDKGNPKSLINYRPLSLLNCDIKILTKTLANRLKQVLPDIIHKTQTAVQGRKIDHTLHTIRDLIQIAENENLDAAFIFIDQEKAFDRVNHQLLFKVMQKYNFGNIFITWIQQLYANATTRIQINGHLTPKIPLKRGVRQGCPISSLLYVLVIEILAAQLRHNQNIVGFTINGEKIISLHYADDATITITQNCCFKEVYKELQDYEQATGAKVNLKKTKGLWVGAWKTRTDSPLGLTWTNENVENLGVFFGNKDPGKCTFQKIIPKLVKSINFWKQFYLCKLAKARVLEIFHASKLWYAAKFYTIPPALNTQIQKLFVDYINWPKKQHTVSKEELFKLRKDGGIKLTHVQHKSAASKCMWLLQLILNPQLHLNLHIVTRLLGVQKGNKRGIDIFFCPHNYTKNHLRINTPFYKEAISRFTSLDLQQHVTPDRIPYQNFFYNRLFLDNNNKPIFNTPRYEALKMFQYRIFLNEKNKQTAHQQVDHRIITTFEKMKTICYHKNAHTIVTNTVGSLPFHATTERHLYHEFIYADYRLHHSTIKWTSYFPQLLEWPKIWHAIHNPISTEKTKTVIWEQLHLNFFTTYSINKWWQTSDPCPFCGTIPQDAKHLILSCPFVQQLWTDFHPYLN
ncbi:MAG: reverse transcriptase domain-containing protein, partial [Bacteroidota bacterium]|nr:reverse transcriptase domain-containing protein [Bacteroidota bacterium]